MSDRSPPSEEVVERTPTAVDAAETERRVPEGVMGMELLTERRAHAAMLARETPEEAEREAANDGRTVHGALLVVANIEPNRMESLRALLQRIVDEDVETNPIVPFLSLRSVHYARILIHEEAHDVNGNAIRAKLLFATDYDGELEPHLDELVRELGIGLQAIFSHCLGHPEAGSLSPGGQKEWLKGHIEEDATTQFVGAVGRSVGQIRREARLRELIDEQLDRELTAGTLPWDPVDIRRRIVEYIFEEQADTFAWAKVQPPPIPEAVPFKTFLLRVGAIGLLLLPITILAAILAGLWLGLLRMKERKDRFVIPPDIKEKAGKLAEQEDLVTQNQLSSVINIKPGFLRDRTLRAVLSFLRYSARYLETGGTLNGIASIHFARWNIVDGGRRLLFFSNFDGSWESYLGEFVDKAAEGLSAVWSNCVGFPATRFLLLDGARDEQRFKAYSRAGQVPTQVWYSAYKSLSLVNVNNNTRIRLGLLGEMDAEQAAEWLRRF
ncbi:MAG: hypothetical protein GEU90_17020 [Gemmatimonas sp.]|nr:hypothetical protein [Gemmatimonas sp.]